MPTILVVDDHDDIRELLRLRLEKRGFTVTCARNGLEAVMAAANAPPSLILMDVNMPELDGLEATMQIHQADEGHRIPVIALTAYAASGDEAGAIAAGCDAFHTKPIDFEKLFVQINQLITTTSAPSS
ncbi:Polar-differentiation response regulator DivK [Novipirellula galeiformis]|uniref:Polar-differentiation response regulator DivK n=1 Tax=Novipirellula galeiformis TaxID=2528004 RepID=A0A5C6BF79_9BACT|nr:response regulator [Novipirellula galeiformis]TWU10392.1 Polar-differentiation response regulator DivK [Novipirellula galeiformis]